MTELAIAVIPRNLINSLLLAGTGNQEKASILLVTVAS